MDLPATGITLSEDLAAPSLELIAPVPGEVEVAAQADLNEPALMGPGLLVSPQAASLPEHPVTTMRHEPPAVQTQPAKEQPTAISAANRTDAPMLPQPDPEAADGPSGRSTPRVQREPSQPASGVAPSSTQLQSPRLPSSSAYSPRLMRSPSAHEPSQPQSPRQLGPSASLPALLTRGSTPGGIAPSASTSRLAPLRASTPSSTADALILPPLPQAELVAPPRVAFEAASPRAVQPTDSLANQAAHAPPFQQEPSAEAPAPAPAIALPPVPVRPPPKPSVLADLAAPDPPAGSLWKARLGGRLAQVTGNTAPKLDFGEVVKQAVAAKIPTHAGWTRRTGAPRLPGLGGGGGLPGIPQATMSITHGITQQFRSDV